MHSVWKLQKKSHSTLRAKRAMFTFSSGQKLRIQMRHFGRFSNNVIMLSFQKLFFGGHVYHTILSMAYYFNDMTFVIYAVWLLS